MTSRERPNQPEPPPELPSHLHPVSYETGWIRTAAIAGVALLALLVPLTFFAPSVVWFLAFPVLIVSSLAALATAAAFLLRRF